MIPPPPPETFHCSLCWAQTESAPRHWDQIAICRQCNDQLNLMQPKTRMEVLIRLQELSVSERNTAALSDIADMVRRVDILAGDQDDTPNS